MRISEPTSTVHIAVERSGASKKSIRLTFDKMLYRDAALVNFYGLSWAAS